MINAILVLNKPGPFNFSRYRYFVPGRFTRLAYFFNDGSQVYEEEMCFSVFQQIPTAPKEKPSGRFPAPTHLRARHVLYCQNTHYRTCWRFHFCCFLGPP